MPRKAGLPPPRLIGPASRLDSRVLCRERNPGLRATAGGSMTPLRPCPTPGPRPGMPSNDAFSYFQIFKPIDRIGHSIYVYKITQEEADGVGSFQQFER